MSRQRRGVTGPRAGAGCLARVSRIAVTASLARGEKAPVSEL